ncbi:TIGR02221 family CRISPR-associated protein [Pelomicrobium methylotrophicum]|uniref:TIGR02221 family CRISPR-associated protein n=1 Tax=Pelomicrobium methylotrophicum TaxID=2602750 RepID=A0A5C7EU15_9PROT|nr:TIGR02221 family CRISPR-associated protein [Pelomicrobium methylotrophicum]TXF11484.1 TIGR02221 family CRISPR-associated protein [Pelomicrobium methylotrophicum]
MHSLVTFLGKGRDDPKTGYRSARYRFPGGHERETAFFGLALAEQLAPQRLVVLGTAGSMWGVFVENLAVEGEEEEARLALLDAEPAARVDQGLLDRLQPLLSRAVGMEVLPRLIPYGRNAPEQRAILETVAEAVPSGKVSFDLTHAFRHLSMLGLVSAFMLERVGKLEIEGIWYGALEMTEGGVALVLRLDGLLAIQRWVDALDRYDATGHYGVFAPLLAADGVPADKTACLEEAAFHEQTQNLADARRKLLTFLPQLETSLPGASGIFQKRLAERLAWVRGADLAEHQRKLAYQYLARGDYLRAAIFGWEAFVSRQCLERGLDPQQFKEGREVAFETFEQELQAGQHEDRQREAYWMLKNLRNALVHGNAPSYPKFRQPLASADRLYKALEASFKRLLG